MDIGRKAIAKLQERHGSVYLVGNIAEIICEYRLEWRQSDPDHNNIR